MGSLSPALTGLKPDTDLLVHGAELRRCRKPGRAMNAKAAGHATLPLVFTENDRVRVSKTV